MMGGPEPPEYSTFFVETSLGTRLATVIHASATVSDAKRQIALEHSQSFPGMRDFKILSLQVQQYGHFYRLSESMPLASFYGEPTWSKSLFAEASISEHDEKVGILDAEVKTRSSLEGVAVDHGTGTVNAIPDHVGRVPLLLTEGREVSAGPSAGDEGRTTVAQFTYREELLQERLDTIDEGHPSGTDEESANPNIPVVGSKETSISHDTKKRKRAIKEVAGLMVSSAEEQGKSMAADNAVPQIENGVEMDQSVSADLLAQSEAIGNAASFGPKRKKRKVERQNDAVVELATTDHGLSSEPLEQVANVDMNPQITLTQDAVKQASESVDVDVLSQREELEIIQNQEGNLPPIDACLNEERAADIYGNVSRDDNGGTDRNLVAGQSEDVQEIEISGNREERKKKKKKRRSSAVEDMLISGMEEQSQAEGSEASLIPIQEVENKTPRDMDVYFSVAPGEVRAADIYENVSRDDNGGTDGNLVAVQSEDVQQIEISGNRKEKKKKGKRSRSSAVEDSQDTLTSRMEEQSQDVGSEASLNPIQEVENKTPQDMDVSFSVAPGEGEEALQKQEVLLPLVDVHPDHKNLEELDGNAREVVTEEPAVDQLGRDHGKGSSLMKNDKKKRKKGKTSSTPSVEVSVSVAPGEGEATLQKEEALTEKPNGEDLVVGQLGRDQEKGSNLMKKEKRLRKKGTNSESKGESAVQIEKNDLGTTDTEVPLKNRPETDTDDKIDFLSYFMLSKSQSEIDSSVNVIGVSRSIKQKKVKDQHDAAITQFSETQGSGKSPDYQEDDDSKLEQSSEPKKVTPLINKKVLKPSRDGGVVQTSTLKKGKKPAIASRSVGNNATFKGSADAVQNTKIEKQNALSTGKVSKGRSLLKKPGKAKSLFNTERTLFTHSESESSSGENKAINAVPRTLPHSRSSSSDSSSESDASQDSVRKGTGNDGKTSSGAGKSVSSKNMFPSLAPMTMDSIIKSSRRYKKAKLTASQSQEPDSQA